MPGKVVAVCHGLDELHKDYAAPLINNLSGCEVTSLFWCDIPLISEARMNSDAMRSKAWEQLEERQLRVYIDHFVGDMLVWFNPVTKSFIKERIAYQLTSTKPEVLVLHSWGSCILVDMFYDSSFNGLFSNVNHIITCGSPLLAYETLVRGDTPTPSFKGRWTNFFHPLDLVASPLAAYLSDHIVSDINDIKITDAGPIVLPLVGDLNVFAAGDAHRCYWHSKQVGEAVTQ